MRVKHWDSLSVRLAMVFALAIVAIQAAILFIDRTSDTTLGRDRALKHVLNDLGGITHLMSELPAEYHPIAARSFSEIATQFFLLPELVTGPSAVPLPDFEAQIRLWAERRNLAVRDVYTGRFTTELVRRPSRNEHRGISNSNPTVLSAGSRPRVIDIEMIQRVPGWVPLPRPKGARPRPAPRPDEEVTFEISAVDTIALQMEETGEWLVMYRLDRPPPNNDVVAGAYLSVLATLIVVAIGLIVGRRVISPFVRLAKSAEQLGRGEKGDVVPLSGPPDMQSVIAAFNQMNARVSQSIDYQIGLLRSLGHDLKGPLAAANRLLEEVTPNSTREQIEARLSNVRGIVDSIMSFSRAVMRDGELQSTDLVELVETLVGEQDELGAAVEFSGPDDPLPVKCRVKATERAIRNLLENATKYGDQARTTLFRAGDMAVLWIDDEGPGIPEDMLDQVFAPFQRLAEDTGGSGLGLAIARTIAVDQGGTVRLENRPEGGLRAEFRLPVSQ